MNRIALPPIPTDRRSALKILAAGAAASWPLQLPADLAPSKKELLVRTESPLNAEPRLSELPQQWVTPISQFYVRSHAPAPAIDPGQFQLQIEGLVRQPGRRTLEQLSELPRREAVATLTCAGNRRNEHSAVRPVSGVAWDAGAIGNAKWSGFALADLLRSVELLPEAKHVWFEGLDEIERGGGVIPFGGSIPIDKALSAESGVPGALLADRMNNEPLPVDHGYPLRTIVPGYIGARSVKWLGKIVVSDRPSPNHYLAGAYKLVPRDEPALWEAAPPLAAYVLNSAICIPQDGARLPRGAVDLQGYCLGPGDDQGQVSRVDVSTDLGRTWIPARLGMRESPFCWRLWKARVTLGSGAHTLLVAATDRQGRRQPQSVPWNLKGYMFNAWHRRAVLVD